MAPVLAVLCALAAPAGLRPGDEVSAWEPVHVAGPHAGTRTCPVCAYLDAPVLLAFAPDAAAAAKLVGNLEAIAAAHARGRLKVILVVVEGSDEQLQKLAMHHAVRHLMLCRPDPERRDKQLRLYKVDPAAASSVLLYADYTVRKTWPAADLRAAKAAAAAYLPKK